MYNMSQLFLFEKLGHCELIHHITLYSYTARSVNTERLIKVFIKLTREIVNPDDDYGGTNFS